MAATPIYRIAVAGNPNSGKTTLFNGLTGSNQKVGNYPGVTVEKKEGRRHVEGSILHFVDLPGTYSLTTFSLDEVVARNYILEEAPDVILDVIDASNLERNLYLAIQLAEIGVPMVLALNMHDVAEQRGMSIDAEKLSAALGVPVVLTVGHRRESAEELLTVISQVAMGQVSGRPNALRYSADIEPAIEDLLAELQADEGTRMNGQTRWMAVKLLEQDAQAGDRLRKSAREPEGILRRVHEVAMRIEDKLDEEVAMIIAEQRYARASELVREVVRRDARGESMTEKLDKVLCHRVFGLISVAVAVYATFALTFKLADGWAYIPWPGGWQTPVGVCGWFFEDFLVQLFNWLGAGPLRSLIVDGIIAGVGGCWALCRSSSSCSCCWR